MKRGIVGMALVVGLALMPSTGESAVDAQAVAKQSLEHYFQAWNEADEDARRDHLKKGWAEDATYTDPSADVNGREALVKHIGEFVGNPEYKGFTIDRVSEIDIHHHSFRFQWEMRDPNGVTVVPGIDYGEFNEDGVITKIVGFFGPFQPLAK